VDFGTGDAEDDDPEGGEGWGEDRQVRAEVLVALVSGAFKVEPGQAGAVYLQHARVIGKIDLPGGAFRHPLWFEECRIADGIDLSEATTRTLVLTDCYVGPSRLVRAKINGMFALRGAHLDGKDGPALNASGLTVATDMICDGGLQAEGTVSLTDASIGGGLSLRDAHLNGEGGAALDAARLTVAKDMLCDEGFQAEGEINLFGARIGGALSFSGARLDGKGGAALDALGLIVAGDMLFDGGFQAEGAIDLRRARIGGLRDPGKPWPHRLYLDGLAYDDLTYLPARERLDWLNRSVRSAGYSAQPYEQLAGHYRQLGHDEQARRVLLAKQRQRTRQRPRWARWWGWLQDALAGYGYAPGRALLLLAGAFIVGCLVFRARHPVPVGPGPHPTFNSALYTLDVLIPAPALGQASDFDPQGAGLAVAAGLHILGWLLAITVIAAITRSFSRT
jgi:hypothetical protein